MIEEFEVSGPDAGPYGIAAGPDGALWFTMVHAGKIGRFVPGGGLTTYDLAPGSGPSMITTGSDGAMWFTRLKDHKIGRITSDGGSSSASMSRRARTWGDRRMDFAFLGNTPPPAEISVVS